LQNRWNKHLDEFTKAYPEEAHVLKRNCGISTGMDKDLGFGTNEAMATRQASGKVLDILKRNLPG
jgi:transketolase